MRARLTGRGGRVLVLGFIGLWTVVSVPAQVAINEVLVDNRAALSNGDEYPDYVELFNPSSQAVALGGLSLSDDPAQPRQFVFPAGAVLGPGGYLTIWCDKSTNAPGWHTGFGLSATGDRLALYAADGATVLDAVTFGLQLPDLSLGRIPNATGAWTLTTPTPGQPNLAQPLAGPDALRLNEWMADDAPQDDWIELHNTANLPVPLGGLVLTDSLGAPTNRPLPALSFIAPLAFTRFWADDLAQSSADHLDLKLSASKGETLTLLAADRAGVLDRVSFGAQTAHVSQGRLPDGAATIVSFPANRATPGASNFLPLTNVVVNELLAHTDPPLEDAVELYNPTDQPVDIGSWYLSNSRNDPTRYRIPPNTVIAPGGFHVLYQGQFDPFGLGFTFNSYEKGEVVLSAADAAGQLTGYLLAQSFDPTENAVSLGRFQTSQGPVFTTLAERTFGVDQPPSVDLFRQGTGKTNAYPKVGPVVISEVMYHPPDLATNGTLADNLNDAYLELRNATALNVPLYDPLYPTNAWRLRGVVSYDFPLGRALPPNGFALLVGFDPADAALLAAFRQKYSVPEAASVWGPYQGNLDHRQGRIELLKPDAPQAPDRPKPGWVPYVSVDRLDYEDRAPWPSEPDGSGLSLQRCSPAVFANEPRNWVAAAPTVGRVNTWTAPRIESWSRHADGALTLRFQAWAANTYVLEYADRLPAAGWTRFAIVTVDRFTGGVELRVSPPEGRASGYYRLRHDGD